MSYLSRRMKLVTYALTVGSLLCISSTSYARIFPSKQHITAGIFLESIVVPAHQLRGNIRPISSHGLSVTEQAEGWSTFLYNDSSGFCTIGYGHLIKRSRCNGTESLEFLRGISKIRGVEILNSDMYVARLGVSGSIKALVNSNQYASLCDFTFNVGVSNFKGSGLRRAVERADGRIIPAQFRRWTYSNGSFVQGLLNRRNQEIALFFEGLATPSKATTFNLSPLDIRTGRAPAR